MVKRHIPNLIFAIVLAMAAWPLINTYGPRIEGYLFPVSANVRITSYLPKILGWTEISGAADKLRSCNFDRLEWFLENDGSIVRAEVNFLERTKARPSGDFNWGPWAVRLEAREIETKSTAYVYHRCHPFWLTRTQFWP